MSGKYPEPGELNYPSNQIWRGSFPDPVSTDPDSEDPPATTEPEVSRASLEAHITELESMTSEDLTTIERLRAEVQSLRAEYRDMRAEADRAEELKVEVGRKAMELAREYDWCEVVQRALEELGIPVTPNRKTFNVVVTYTVTADSSSSGSDSENWIRSSLITPIEYPGMDSDWENVEVTEDDVAILNIEDVEV